MSNNNETVHIFNPAGKKEQRSAAWVQARAKMYEKIGEANVDINEIEDEDVDLINFLTKQRGKQTTTAQRKFVIRKAMEEDHTRDTRFKYVLESLESTIPAAAFYKNTDGRWCMRRNMLMGMMGDIVDR